jgi:integrase
VGIYRRGEKWGIDYYEGSRRTRKLVSLSKGEAKKRLANKQSETLSPQSGTPPTIKSEPFNEFVEQVYTPYAKANKRGFYNEQYRLKQLVNYFGNRKLSQLTRGDAETFKIEMSRERGPATVNRLMGNLKHILSVAVQFEKLSVNPFIGVKLLSVPNGIDRILTQEEETKLLAACDKVRTPHLRASVVIALNTGMRKGEIYGLRWESVDLETRWIRVLNGKTESSDRWIPINDAVFSSLSDLKLHKTGDFVFPSPRKAEVRFRDPKKGFAKAIRLAGIPHLRFHDLRHTFATRLVRLRADIVTVQHLMGHSKITMTQRYTHSLADDKILAVNRLDLAGVR